MIANRQKSLVFLIFALGVQILVAEMNWENMVIKVSADDQLSGIEGLKNELYALPYDNSKTVGDFLKTNFESEKRLFKLLKRHFTVNHRYLTDGRIEVEYQLHLNGKILSLLLPQTKPVKLVVPMLCPYCGQEWPQNRPVPEGLELVAKEFESSNYTGIIIDCRGLELKPCLFSLVYDDLSQEIFSINFADLANVIDGGLVLWTKEEVYNNPRIGDNPLRIRAIDIKRENGTDIVISSFDARRIHGSKKNLELLKECRIAVILGP